MAIDSGKRFEYSSSKSTGSNKGKIAGVFDVAAKAINAGMSAASKTVKNNQKSKSKSNTKAKKTNSSAASTAKPKAGTPSPKQQKITMQSSYSNGEVFVCAWDVWISGTLLDDDRKYLINSIQVKETVDGSDTATLEIQDPNFEFLEDNIFMEDNNIKITMGWEGYANHCTFNGYISFVDITYPDNGIPKLTLTCMDKTYLMDKEVKSNTYKNTTSAAVVQTICKQYGFKCVIQKGYAFPKQETITQSSQTDINFIQKLAQDEVFPFTARLVGNTFYYVKKGAIEDKADMELTYREYPYDIVSFDPKINKVSKDNVEKGSTNTTSKTSGTAKASAKSNGKSSSKNTNKSNKRDTAKYDKKKQDWQMKHNL